MAESRSVFGPLKYSDEAVFDSLACVTLMTASSLKNVIVCDYHALAFAPLGVLH